MHVSWLGQTCVKLQTKNGDEDVLVLIDAYKPKTGDFPRSFTPDVALFSVGEDNAATLSQEPFVLSTLGEIDKKGVLISSIPGTNDSLVFSLTIENMHVVHLGHITKYDEGLTERLGSVDILLLPVGGDKNYLSPEDAAHLVTALEPRIIIPIGYKCDSDPSAEPLSAFLKESGLKATTEDKKFIVKKKELPQEETQLVVLEKNI